VFFFLSVYRPSGDSSTSPSVPPAKKDRKNLAPFPPLRSRVPKPCLRTSTGSFTAYRCTCFLLRKTCSFLPPTSLSPMLFVSAWTSFPGRWKRRMSDAFFPRPSTLWRLFRASTSYRPGSTLTSPVECFNFSLGFCRGSFSTTFVPRAQLVFDCVDSAKVTSLSLPAFAPSSEAWPPPPLPMGTDGD